MDSIYHFSMNWYKNYYILVILRNNYLCQAINISFSLVCPFLPILNAHFVSLNTITYTLSDKGLSKSGGVGVGEIIGSILSANRSIAKEIKSGSHGCYVRCATIIL